MTAARIAARQTFGPFVDEVDSPFYQAANLSPEETWERLAERVALVTAAAVLQGMRDEPLRRILFERWHAEVFGELFPERGGVLRTGRDQAQFGVLLGTRDQPVAQTYVSTGAHNLPRRLDEICAAFDRFAGEDREYGLRELVEEAVRLYVRFLNLHPFEDGNGRVAYVLLQFALARLDLPAVALPDHEEHQWVLGRALRRDGKRTDAHLVQLLVDKLEEAGRIFEAIRAQRQTEG
jgi:fido (protein-threonine AMPylation protein)